MSVLMPFQSLIGNIPDVPLGTEAVPWEFGNDLDSKGSHYFNPLVEKHKMLDFTYSALTTQIVHNVHFLPSDKLSVEDEQKLTKQLICALSMSILLAHIYHYYLNVPREVESLLKDQEIYRSALKQRGFIFGEVINKPNSSYNSFMKTVRSGTIGLNWPRLIAARSRRVLITLVPVLSKYKGYAGFINKFDKYLGPTLNHISWIFYIPRLLFNILMLLKHTIPGPWMLAKEKELNWLTRIEAQLQRRWFEMGNDAIWLIGNALCCFLLVGGLSPVGMYLTVAIFLFDVIWAGLRAFIELRRISKLEKEFSQRSDLSDEERKLLTDYQKHLRQCAIHEQKRLLLSVISTTLLFLAMCLAIPALAFNPIIALVGAILVITITIATYLINEWIETQKPKNNIKEKKFKEKIGQLPCGFFGVRQRDPLDTRQTLSSASSLNLLGSPSQKDGFSGSYIAEDTGNAQDQPDAAPRLASSSSTPDLLGDHGEMEDGITLNV